MEPLAHSGRAKRGIATQKYAAHVETVRDKAKQKLRAAQDFRMEPEAALDKSVHLAGEFHDLGKLEPQNQAVLAMEKGGRLPINHVDAGVAHLLNIDEKEAARAVYCHHIGLYDFAKEYRKAQLAAEDPRQAAFRIHEIKLETDDHLGFLLSQHNSCVKGNGTAGSGLQRKLSGFERRLLLSCLVDADHSDTAHHYGEYEQPDTPATRWKERLDSLDRYVAKLGEQSGSRTELRTEIYNACRGASPNNLIFACDSPVGSGKTTAIMAYLLQAAIALKLRHIFVVLPFTNIVQQSVATYRKALTLPGEDPEAIVAAHHHQAEFKSPDLRFLTTLWDAPVIVTTAVQFFETLGSCQTARLRKLHQLPGSAVFIDEAHAAMPIHIWPFMWDQMNALAKDWKCRFVLGSGSLARFWENSRIMDDAKTEIPSMIKKDIQESSSHVERSRVVYRRKKEILNLETICNWIEESKGSRLVVLNTVQSAAVVAQELRRKCVPTLHISTALAPAHRNAILRLVRFRLKTKPKMDWVLVATSCVEAGVDFSFQSAFRERCRATSLVQIGGRVNRHGGPSTGEVWDFVFNDPLLTCHPDFEHTRRVVEDIFDKEMWGQDLTRLMTWALEQEFKRTPKEAKIEEIQKSERRGSYPEVAKLTRLITSDTRLVVVDAELIKSIRSGERVDRKDLMSKSVQLWSSKIGKLALEPLGFGEEELYAWQYDYDPKFLGTMAGILKLNQIDRDGFALV